MFMALESARADIVHYVRVTQQTVLRDRTIVPAGGEIAVKYDTGDAWLPYMQLSFPRIAKSAGTLIEALLLPGLETSEVSALGTVINTTTSNWITQLEAYVAAKPA